MSNPRNYVHLINPLHTMVRTGEGIHDAPYGKFALSKNPKTNVALWNALITSAVALPVAYLLSDVANKKAERELDESVDENQISHLQAVRPDANFDADLLNLDAQVTDPKKELAILRGLEAKLENNPELEKSASGDDDDVQGPGFFNRVYDAGTAAIKQLIGEGGKNALPIIAFAAAAAGGVHLANKKNKERIKAKLKARAIQTANLQSAIDRQMLQEMGLTTSRAAAAPIAKAASSEYEDAARDRVMRKAVSGEEDKGKVAFFTGPTTLHMLLGLGTGIGAYLLMRNRDKNIAKLKYLKDVKLGSNALAESPRLSLSDLPVKTNEILITPGDTKQETLTDDPEAAKIAAEIKARKALVAQNAAPTDIIDVKPIEDSGIFQEVKKKDALFA